MEDSKAMRLSFTRCALIGLAGCAASPALADDPREIFFDKNVLQNSIVEISKMSEPELRG
jgi:hypothetical protein